MTSADVLQDNIPHGTPEGFDLGCRSAACPAGEAFGLACKTAKRMSRSDYQYQRLARTGATPAEIADQLGLIGTGATPPPIAARPKTKAKTKPKPPAPEPEPEPTVAELVASSPSKTPANLGDTDPQDHDDTAAAEPATNPAGTPTTQQIREWAKDRGYEIASHGRIPKHIRDHYLEDHADGHIDEATEPKDPIELARQIRDYVGPLRRDDGTLDASRVAQEVTLREKNNLPAWIAELDADLEAAAQPFATGVLGNFPDDAEHTEAPSEKDPEPRPEWSDVAIHHDLQTAIKILTAERDSARRIAVHLEQELGHAEEKISELNNDITTLLTLLRFNAEWLVDQTGRVAQLEADIAELRAKSERRRWWWAR